MQSYKEIKLTREERERERERTEAQDLGELLFQVYAHASNSFPCKNSVYQQFA